MRTFSCFTVGGRQDAPALTLIITSSLQRARVLARRELMQGRDDVAVEICEGSQVLWVETASHAGA